MSYELYKYQLIKSAWQLGEVGTVTILILQIQKLRHSQRQSWNQTLAICLQTLPLHINLSTVPNGSKKGRLLFTPADLDFW